MSGQRGRGVERGRGQWGGRGGRGDRGSGRGMGRGRGGSRSTKPTRFQEFDCPELVSISELMNTENAFYLVRNRSVYTDVDVQNYREECLRSMVAKPEANRRGESTIAAPADLAAKLHELMQRNKTDKGFMNCWRLSGSLFDERSFHGWTITFNPQIPMHEKLERKIQLFGGIVGGDWDARRKKTELLQEVFGHIAFDNQSIWTTENSVPDNMKDEAGQFTISKSQFNTSYDITFAYQGMASLANTPLQEAERLIHLSFLRPALAIAGFVKDGPQERKWFPKNRHPLRSVSTVNESKEELALDVVAGYRITVHLKKQNMDEGQERIFPVLKISTQSRLDLHDNCLTMLMRGFEKCNGIQKDFRSKADERDRFIGRSAYLLYGGQRNITINEIDWASSEKTLITDKNISVANYLKTTYSDEVKEVHESPCTFKRLVGSDEHFLPEFIKMTAKSSDSPMNYGKALELMAKAPVHRMKEIQNVCQNINDAIQNSENLKGKVVIADCQETVDMIHLANPLFAVQNKRGHNIERFAPTELPGAWGRNAGGPIRDEKIADGPAVALSQWKIIYFQNLRNHADQLLQHVEAYRGMRKLDRHNLLQNPTLAQVYFKDEWTEEKTYQQVVSRGDQLLLVILPPKIGSMIKTYFTKAIHYTNHPQPPQLQFILSENCFNKNAALAAISNALAKVGNVMYQLAEPYNGAYGLLKDAWAVGLDVAHNGQQKPSIACMALITKPLSGTTKFWRPSCIANKPRQEVLSGRMADGLMRSLLEDVFTHDLVARATKQNMTVQSLLPTCMIIIRDGLADDQIYESVNEELLGIDSAIRKFANSKKINWQPKLIALVSPKAGQDDICRIQPTGPSEFILRSPGMPSKPIVVIPQGMMHRSWFEFYMIGNPKDSKAKPRRYVMVRDDAGVTKAMRNFNCLCNYILALMWGFCISIPFSTGCSSQPSCVKVAKHYAELMSQIILSSDANFSRFSVNRTNRPHIAIKDPLPSVATEEMIE
jgi:hypothetical protein